MIVGIIVMVPGFPFVLHSRLHLVIRKPKDAEHSPHLYLSRRRRLPLTEAFYGLASDDPMKYVSLLLPADSSTSMGTSSRKLCLPVYISGQPMRLFCKAIIHHKRKAAIILIGCQILVVCLDIPLLVLAWMNLSKHGATLVLGVCHPTIYAVKLKMELIVLN